MIELSKRYILTNSFAGFQIKTVMIEYEQRDSIVY